MRRVLLGSLGVLALLAVSAVPAGAVPLRSDNVHLLTKLPEAVGAIGARFSADGQTMYTTTPDGLHIFDISDPKQPIPVGFQPLPHFENEDVDVDQARKLVIITNDPSFTTAGVLYVIDVSDPSFPRILDAEPTRIPGAAVRDAIGDKGTSNGHIANCIQGCRYVWTTGQSEGITVFDLADPANVKLLGTFQMPKPLRHRGFEDPESDIEPGFTHDVFVDPSGIAWITGEDGTFGYRTDGNPLQPQIVYRSDENLINSGDSGPTPDGTDANAYPLDFLHHNSIRTSINLHGPPTTAPYVAPPAQSGPASTRPTKAKPRKLTGCARFHTAKVRAKCRRAAARARAACRRKRSPSKRASCLRKALRRYGPAPKPKPKSKGKAKPKSGQGFSTRTSLGGLGDVIAVTEEDYDRPTCNGQGSLQTWQISDERNSDGTIKLKLLDLWTTELNELVSQSGRSPATVECSAHWFDENRGLLAQGWYDQGVRFMDITDPRNIRQVGYYATTGEFWAAYFAPSDPSVVYALDTAGGIDVLQIDRAAGPSKMRTRRLPQSAVEAQMRDGSRVATPTPKWGFACRIPRLA